MFNFSMSFYFDCFRWVWTVTVIYFCETTCDIPPVVQVVPVETDRIVASDRIGGIAHSIVTWLVEIAISAISGYLSLYDLQMQNSENCKVHYGNNTSLCALRKKDLTIWLIPT